MCRVCTICISERRPCCAFECATPPEGEGRRAAREADHDRAAMMGSVRRALLVGTFFPLVAASVRAPSTPSAAGGAASTPIYAASDAALRDLEPLLRAALEANRKQFRGRTGVVRGFG